ncbi:MAG: hypothetical protein AUJ92_01530 [Armatimonadetes bacterium CG2_30_59_28]|nr:MAG: hypothetical protein AUJ92_01530 [Armatimonadetes bacterium CG2_30_59_28]PIU63871.1 MAG: hypothetical protein COS85_14680 [Armatimonadetes bacterium CG07_land_8_20_14_0_80_59_28]PIX38952.1 MAG: hypothetical protein COZ56_19045 [Armatimonadetes bacterium CG_4_8_14_3_um_filter_58_9]PIY48474.1 MAG: hypothetical protein COZ05_02995 [Armatimonadetes bacterium CG_4_10_14_3_um_filter_59_10]
MMESDRTSVTLRTVRDDDLPRIKQLVEWGWAGQGTAWLLEQRHGQLGGKPWLEWKWPEVEAACRERPDQVLVSEWDGEVVGFASFRIDPVREIGMVGNNTVDPAHRGKGIGQTQLARVLQIFRERGLRFAEVTVALNEGHAAAKSLYEKAGFETVVDSRYMFMPLA